MAVKKMSKAPHKTENVPVITVDGPSGSGKGTIGIMLANELGWNFLDSGSLYRLLAFSALNKKIALSDEAALVSLVYSMNIQFNQDVFLDGQRVTKEIRTETCGNAASQVAVLPGVRGALLAKQQAFCKPPGLVADGRDMGTVVFPGAIIKFFLDASAEERAKRRFLQLKEQSENVTLQSLLREIMERDLRDKTRAVAPLKPAEEAVVINTTGMGIEAVFDQVIFEVKSRLYGV
jgi:cytidylate kinase